MPHRLIAELPSQVGKYRFTYLGKLGCQSGCSLKTNAFSFINVCLYVCWIQATQRVDIHLFIWFHFGSCDGSNYARDFLTDVITLGANALLTLNRYDNNYKHYGGGKSASESKCKWKWAKFKWYFHRYEKWNSGFIMFHKPPLIVEEIKVGEFFG